MGSYRHICSSGVYSSYNNGKADAKYSTVIRAYRWVEDNEVIPPTVSTYKFELCLQRSGATKRHQHDWILGNGFVDGVLRYNAVATVWPNITSSYKTLAANTLYPLYAFEIQLNNNGATHTVQMNATCTETIPRDNSATLRFAVPTSSITPGSVTGIKLEGTGLDDVVNVVWNAATKAQSYEISYQKLDCNGNLIPNTAVVSSTGAYTRASFNLKRDLLPGQYFNICVRSKSSTGNTSAWSNPIQIRRLGFARIKQGNSFIVAVPYIKQANGTWLPATAYIKNDNGTWQGAQ